MRRPTAAVGSLAFLVLAPGVVAGLVPWLLTGWDSGELSTYWLPLRVFGALLIVAGVVVLLHAFVRFVGEGLCTRAPIAPTEHLVVGGSYPYVRNPMYVAVAAIIVGQAFVLGSGVLLAYTVVFLVAVVSFVLFYEEPTLRRQFGEEYETYRSAVPGWRPRLHPWHPDERPTLRVQD